MSAGVAYLYSREAVAVLLAANEQERRIRLAASGMALPSGRIWREQRMTPRQRRRSLPVRSAIIHRLNLGATILVADLAVLGRNLPDLIATLAQAEACGAAVLIAIDGRGTVRPVSAADLDAARRAYGREAIMEGRAKARERGVRFGRPMISVARVEKVRDALAQGLGVRAAARAGGVGVATASRIRDAAMQSA